MKERVEMKGRGRQKGSKGRKNERRVRTRAPITGTYCVSNADLVLGTSHLPASPQ